MLFPPRSPDTHKGNYGKVLVIGGCIGYTGAPYLAASAAFRTGSGLVYMAVPECIYSIEAVKCNEIICLPFESDQDGGFSFQSLSRLSELASKCDVCVIGPGLGRSDGSDRLVSGLLGTISCPVILDADGINAVSGNINVLSERAAQKKTTVLTPHDVEFERLGGDRSKGRIQSASELSHRLGAVVVLKGNTTVTAAPDGRAMINTTGNPGMAKGGSGDLLAGVIASLIGRGAEPASAAAAGAFIHGAAGDSAARIFGEYGMLPTDLLNEIPTTLKNGGMA
jgi:NAD(P)H-hydrate epimerase